MCFCNNKDLLISIEYHGRSEDSVSMDRSMKLRGFMLSRDFLGSIAFKQQLSRSAPLSTSLLSAILLPPLWFMSYTCLLIPEVRKKKTIMVPLSFQLHSLFVSPLLLAPCRLSVSSAENFQEC